MRSTGLDAWEGTFPGGLPYLAVGLAGDRPAEPLVYLCGGTPNHVNPPPGLQTRMTMRTVAPLARAGYTVYFTNRWPGMPAGITWSEVAEGHASAIAAHFGEPVHVLGHSTGGSVLLQLLVDQPHVVRRAVVASAAYTLGTVARRAQRVMIESVARTGGYTADAIAATLEGVVPSRAERTALQPLLAVMARRVRVDRPSDTLAMLRAEDDFDVRGRLPEIPTETLVVGGVKDRFWSLDMFAETAYRMPRGRLILYRDLGHGLVTSPRFAADVAAFLH